MSTLAWRKESSGRPHVALLCTGERTTILQLSTVLSLILFVPSVHILSRPCATVSIRVDY